MKHQTLLRRDVATPPRHRGGGGSHHHATTTSGHSDRRRWRPSVPRLSRFAVEHLLLLPAGALAAVVWSNTHAESYYAFTYPIAFAVNDIAMVFFFALMTKEVVEATAPGGVLHPWRRAALPMVASLGLVLIPALLFVPVVHAFDEPMLARAWLVPAAVDLALAYFIARIIFRPHHAVIPFVLLLAIAANVITLMMLALLYPTRELHPLMAAVLLAAALASAGMLRRSRVKNVWAYVLIAGGLSWAGLYWGGLHPALALVFVLPFVPHARRDPGFFVDALPEARDPLSHFEHTWRYPVQGALFFFGLVNAGVPMRALEAGFWTVPIAAFAGKPLGLLAGIGLALAVGLHLPHRVGWRELIVVGLVITVGFTIALYLATAVLGPGQLLTETRMGVLLCTAGAPLAIVAARLLRVGRFGR